MLKRTWDRRLFLGAAAGSLASACAPPRPTGSVESAFVGHVPYARGAKIPANIERRIRAQNGASRGIAALMEGDRGFMHALTAANPHFAEASSGLPADFDWRTLNKVTPVKDQKECGSCWVFAANAAYESAWLIANQKNAIDEQGYLVINVSEQQPLDCGFVETDCVLGGWHEEVFVYLILEGAANGWRYPYRAIKTFCTSNIDRPYHLLNWDYVTNEDGLLPASLVPSTEALKTAIYRYGPIASSVATRGFDTYRQTKWDGSANADWPADGVFQGVPSSSLQRRDIDHEVAVIGWDDREGVWIVRNSWGPGWGIDGYMKLKYDANMIGFGASWAQVEPEAAASSSLSARIRALNAQSPLAQFYPNAFAPLQSHN